MPTLASLGVSNAKQLRFVLNASPYPENNLYTCSNSCDFNYQALQVNQLKFFVAVSPNSPYCAQTPSPCATVASVRLGEHYARDTDQVVIYSTVLVSDPIEVDLGDSASFQLTKSQWQALNKAVHTVEDFDPNDPQFYLGFAVSATAVDATPNDTSKTNIVPFSEILTIDAFGKDKKDEGATASVPAANLPIE